MDVGARLGHGRLDRGGRGNVDRARGVLGTEHDGEHPALWLRGCRGRRSHEPRRRRGRRRNGGRHRKSRGDLHPLCRPRVEAVDRACAHRFCPDREAERAVRPHRRAPGVMAMKTRSAFTDFIGSLGAFAPYRRWLIFCLALLIVLPLPFLVKNFFVFQLTLAMVYAIAILGLNLLTGFNGQFSLGHSAFYAIGAYTAAILMDQYDVAYYWTLPIAGIICFVAGFLFGLPALRLEGIYLALATFALAVAMPQILKLSPFEHWTGGVQGIVIIKPNAPFGLPLNPDQWLYYFTFAVMLALFLCAYNLVS